MLIAGLRIPDVLRPGQADFRAGQLVPWSPTRNKTWTVSSEGLVGLTRQVHADRVASVVGKERVFVGVDLVIVCRNGNERGLEGRVVGGKSIDSVWALVDLVCRDITIPPQRATDTLPAAAVEDVV